MIDGHILPSHDAARLRALGGNTTCGSAGRRNGIINIADGGYGRQTVTMNGYRVEANVSGADPRRSEKVVLKYQCVAVTPALQAASVVA